MRGSARCQEHQRQQYTQDRDRRGSATERGYDSRWRKARLTFLASHPLCVQCQADGRIVAAEVVDHVRAHKGDWNLFWDSDNWRSLCKRCHDARVDEGDFGRRSGT